MPIGPVSGPGNMTVWPNQHGSGSRNCAEDRKLPRAGIFGVDRPDPIRPRSDVEVPGLAEIEQYRPGIVQQVGYPQRTICGVQLEIGHAASEHGMPIAEVVVNVQTRHHRGEPLARPVHTQQFGQGVPQGVDAVIAAQERGLRHRVVQDPRSDRVALCMVGLQEGFRRCALNHLGQLPSQIHCILHADIEALSADREMHMCGISGQQDSSVPVRGGLPGHIGESGD